MGKQYTTKLNDKLDIKQASYTVLGCLKHLLDDTWYEIDEDKDEIRLNTFAFYNCRERSIGVTINQGFDFGNKTRVVLFGECRSSDMIFVDTFQMAPSANPPTLNDYCHSNAYENRKEFNPDDVMKVAQYIVDTFIAPLQW